MNQAKLIKALGLILVIFWLGLQFAGCAKKPLPWSRELDRKALKIFNEGQEFYNRRKYWSARRRYNKVIDKFSRSRYADNARFMLGEIYAAKGDYESAVDEYHKVTERYPASELLPQIAEKEYEIATFYWNTGKKCQQNTWSISVVEPKYMLILKSMPKQVQSGLKSRHKRFQARIFCTLHVNQIATLTIQRS